MALLSLLSIIIPIPIPIRTSRGGYAGPPPTLSEIAVIVAACLIVFWLGMVVISWLLDLSVGDAVTLRGRFMESLRFFGRAVRIIW